MSSSKVAKANAKDIKLQLQNLQNKLESLELKAKKRQIYPINSSKGQIQRLDLLENKIKKNFHQICYQQGKEFLNKLNANLKAQEAPPKQHKLNETKMKYVKAVNLLKKPWQDGKLSRQKIRLRRLNQIIQKNKEKRTRRTNI